MNKQDIDENLPWYVNGQMSEQEKAEFEQAIKDDTEAQQEVEFLNKLRNQLKQNAEPSPGEFGLQRLKRDIKSSERAPVTKRWRTLAVAASLLMVVQAGVMVSMMQTEEAGVGIQPLSGSHYTGTVLQLQFTGDASAEDIRQALLSVGGSIIEGPSSSGIYRVRLKDEQNERVQQHIAQLQANHKVIDFVAEE